MNRVQSRRRSYLSKYRKGLKFSQGARASFLSILDSLELLDSGGDEIALSLLNMTSEGMPSRQTPTWR